MGRRWGWASEPLGSLVNTVFMGPRHPVSPCVTSQSNTPMVLCAPLSPPTGTVAVSSIWLSPLPVDSAVPPQAPCEGVWEGAVAEITRRLLGELPGYGSVALWEGCGPPSEGLGFECGLCHPPRGAAVGTPDSLVPLKAPALRGGHEQREGDPLGSPAPAGEKPVGRKGLGFSEGTLEDVPAERVTATVHRSPR